MTGSGPDVSVIICAYTEARWSDLKAAVASVQRQTLPPRELLVVVDHNLALLKQAHEQLDGVMVIANSEQRGLSGARNSGIRAAQGMVVAFLDDDAQAAPDWIAQLTAAYADPCVVGVGGAITPFWPGRRPVWFPEEFDWVIGCTYRGLPQCVTPVRNFIGANMSFRRELFDVIGSFRSDMGRVGTQPVGCEETELCIRIHQRLAQPMLLYQPDARVYHRVPPGRTNWTYFRSRCYGEGRSKAQMATFVGTVDGLSSERTYTLRTLPHGVGRGVRDGVLRGDPAGIARAGAILAGLAFTVAGYLHGLFNERVMPTKLHQRGNIGQRI